MEMMHSNTLLTCKRRVNSLIQPHSHLLDVTGLEEYIQTRMLRNRNE